MVARPRLKRLSFPLALVAAAVLGAVFAVLVALIPGETLESMVVDSGIAAVVSAAEPPLGLTARLALMVLVGGGTAVLAWFGFFLLVGSRTVSIGAPEAKDGVPVLRRADAHPDAPPRRPLFANEDLGTPFLDIKAPPLERDLPADLDQPIAAFDPSALRREPLPMPEPVAPLKWLIEEPVALAPEPEMVPMTPIARPKTFGPSERFATFALPVEVEMPPLAAPKYVAIEPVPPAATAAEPEPTKPAYREAASIHALLDRLERGAVTRKPVPVPAPALPKASNDSLQDALGTLRRLATRG